MSENIHVALLHRRGLCASAITRFQREIESAGLEIELEEQPQMIKAAAYEWLAPTAIAVFLAKSYFDSFLGEAGKDHYHMLKEAIVRLGQNFFGDKAPTTTIIHTEGKIDSKTIKYSSTFSIYAELGNGKTVKLLIESDIDPKDLGTIVDKFLSFLHQMHDGQSPSNEIDDLDTAKSMWGITLARYDHASKKIVVVDPKAP